MTNKIDTFSANSLKLLEKNLVEFENKYIYNLSIYKKDLRAILGQKFHSLICFYIKGFKVDKLLLDLDNQELSYWKKLEEILKNIKNDFIKTEYSFLVKNEINGNPYYLTGRFDAVYSKEDKIIIYDWKTLNLPKDPENDLQTVVYLYCAYKIFNTDKIKIRYLSIEKLDFVDVEFSKIEVYQQKIEKIIQKLPEYC